MDLDGYFKEQFAAHAETVSATRDAVAEPFARVVEACVAAVRDGHKVIFFGNGGSAADSQHLAAEFVSRFTKDRVALAGLSLTTDTSALTAIGNDYGYEKVFERQIQALGRAGDVAIGISTSGNSPNVLLGLAAAKEVGITPAGFGGGDGGKMVGLADPLILVPSKVTARIQEMHILIGHMICGAVEQELGLV